jgi:hypothetical protein
MKWQNRYCTRTSLLPCRPLLRGESQLRDVAMLEKLEHNLSIFGGILN